MDVMVKIAHVLVILEVGSIEQLSGLIASHWMVRVGLSQQRVCDLTYGRQRLDRRLSQAIFHVVDVVFYKIGIGYDDFKDGEEKCCDGKAKQP